MAHSTEMTPDVTVLLPVIQNWERTTERYSGLFKELAKRGLSATMANGIATYDSENEAFIGGYNFDGEESFRPTNLRISPGTVRDLTMALGDRPLYQNKRATLVHRPAFNEVLADKALVEQILPDLHPVTFVVTNGADLGAALELLPGDMAVIKPAVGSASEDILISNKNSVAEQVAMLGKSRKRVIQGFVETEEGIPELGIEGRHNARVIMIGGRPIFVFGRVAEKGALYIADDSFKNLQFYGPDDFPDDLMSAVDRVREGLATLPDGLNTVVAADFMRGYQEGEDSRMYLCELNRRPLRNSPWDSKGAGNLWASAQWDIHEAQLLSKMVENRL